MDFIKQLAEVSPHAEVRDADPERLSAFVDANGGSTMKAYRALSASVVELESLDLPEGAEYELKDYLPVRLVMLPEFPPYTFLADVSRLDFGAVDTEHLVAHLLKLWLMDGKVRGWKRRVWIHCAFDYADPSSPVSSLSELAEWARDARKFADAFLPHFKRLFPGSVESVEVTGASETMLQAMKVSSHIFATPGLPAPRFVRAPPFEGGDKDVTRVRKSGGRKRARSSSISEVSAHDECTLFIKAAIEERERFF